MREHGGCICDGGEILDWAGGDGSGLHSDGALRSAAADRHCSGGAASRNRVVRVC